MALKGQTLDNILLPSTGRLGQNLWPVPSDVSQFRRRPPSRKNGRDPQKDAKQLVGPGVRRPAGDAQCRARPVGVCLLCSGNTTGSARESGSGEPQQSAMWPNSTSWLSEPWGPTCLMPESWHQNQNQNQDRPSSMVDAHETGRNVLKAHFHVALHQRAFSEALARSVGAGPPP